MTQEEKVAKVKDLKQPKLEYGLPPNVNEGIHKTLALVHPVEEGDQFDLPVTPAVPRMEPVGGALPYPTDVSDIKKFPMAEPQPDVQPPPHQYFYSPDIQADRDRANKLEAEAQMPMDPYKGMSPLQAGITKAARSFTAGYDPDRLAKQRAEYRQGQLDKLGMAKGIKAEAAQREQAQTQQQQFQANEEFRNRQLQQQYDIATQPSYQGFGGGAGQEFGAYNTRNPNQRVVFGTKPYDADKKVDEFPRMIGGKVHNIAVYQKSQDPSPNGRYEVDNGETPMPMGAAGNLQPYFNPDGTIAGFYNTRPGTTGAPQPGPLNQNPPGSPDNPNPVVPPGSRKAPLPAEANIKMASFGSARAIINDIKQYSDKIHTHEGLMARGVGLLRGGEAYLGYDADVTSLQSKSGELAQVLRALGETGNLAEGDVKRGIALLPTNPRLTKTEAAQQINDLLGIISVGETNLKKQFGVGQQSQQSQRLKRTNKRTGAVQFSDDGGQSWHQ